MVSFVYRTIPAQQQTASATTSLGAITNRIKIWKRLRTTAYCTEMEMPRNTTYVHWSCRSVLHKCYKATGISELPPLIYINHYCPRDCKVAVIKIVPCVSTSRMNVRALGITNNTDDVYPGNQAVSASDRIDLQYTDFPTRKWLEAPNFYPFAEVL